MVNHKQIFNDEKELLRILALTVQSINECVSITDIQNNILFVNRSFLNTYGYTEEEILGKHISMLKPPDADPAELEEITHKTLQGGWKGEIINCRKDGTTFPVYLSSSPVFNEKGEIYAMVGIASDLTQQKLTETRLAENDRWIKLIAERVPDIIYIYSFPHRRNIYTSRSLAEMLGYEPGEIDDLSEDFFEKNMHPDDLKQFQQVYGDFPDWDENFVFQFEYRIKHKNGDWRWFTGSEKAFQIENGKVISTIGLVHDFTEKKQAEDKAKFHSLILESIQDLVVAINLEDSTITYVNRAIEPLLTCKHHEITGQPLDMLIQHIDSPDTFKFLFAETLEKNHARGELIFSDCSGQKRNYCVRTQLLRDHKDKPVAIIAIFSDTTEIKKAAEEIQKSNERFRNLFNNMFEGFAIFEAITDEQNKVLDFKILIVNQAFEHHTGIKPDRIIGNTIRNFSPRVSDHLFDFLTRVAMTGQPEQMVDYDPLTERYYEIHAFSPEFKQVAVVITNVTLRVETELQLRKAKEKAEAADRLKTTFINTISHEIRTPLNGILGFADVLMNYPLQHEEKKEAYDLLIKSSERLMQTIEDIMDISLLASGNMTVHYEEICPGDIFQEMHRRYYPEALKKKLAFEVHLPENYHQFRMQCDPDLLRKVLNHLLSNALKFTSHGMVTFGYTTSENGFELFVNDTGRGISEEFSAHLFQPFSQQEFGERRSYEGSGLGLAIVKNIVDLMQGKIHVQSELERGTSITIILPKQSIQALPEEQPVRSHIVETNNQKVILVVDDDFTSYKYFEILLKKLNFKVIHAQTGLEAIHMCQDNHQIDLVLMDMKLPEMDGLEATRQIKKIRPELPVIAQTAFTLSGDEYHARKAGCDAYLPKPINKNDLILLIKKFIPQWTLTN